MTWYHPALAQRALDEGDKEIVGLKAANARLRTALTHARTKIILYRGEHSGEYLGGVEYTQLIREIDEALR